MQCRYCSTTLRHKFLDLGFAPPSNAYLTRVELSRPETYYPLRVMVCHECWLVQTEDFTKAHELFSAEYAYFSSTSSSWLAHAKDYCEQMINRFGLGMHSKVVEVASNDGYLLRNFVTSGIPCLGIEPTASTAEVAEAQGITVLREFFGEALAIELARKGHSADLIAGNNVYAHVPDINDFTRGLRALLKPEGVVTLEFPHLLRLMEQAQFDTIYHEHFSYLSLSAVVRIFESAGLRLWHLDELPTHGGSLRVYGCRADASHMTTPQVSKMLWQEQDYGLHNLDTYTVFQQRANRIKNDLLTFLIEQKKQGRMVVAYGAAAKGNTLLNYAGVKPDLLPYVCDAAAAKQGKFLPGSHIPILSPEQLRAKQPDVVLILPWNIVGEVKSHLADLAATGVQFVTAIPVLRTV